MNLLRMRARKGLSPYLVGISVSVTVFIIGYALVTLSEANEVKTFKFSSTNAQGPVFELASVDPSHVKVGDSQTFKVKVSDPAGVVSVIATTQLDTRKRDIALTPEDESANCTDCVWSGMWEVNDTSDNTYETTIIATNALGEKNSVTISWTDPCSPPISGSWTLDGNCAISDTQGLEEGTFFIPDDKTLTILNGGIWVYQQGHPISIYGTIAIEDGGKLVRSLLWAPDGDNNGYSTSVSAQVASESQPASNYVRRKNLIGFGDCYDENASVKPGQTTYFSSHRGDGSYDYDCSGGEEKKWMSITSCSCSKYSCTSGIGWAGSVPVCGSSGTYYTNTGCGYEMRTQLCR